VGGEWGFAVVLLDLLGDLHLAALHNSLGDLGFAALFASPGDLGFVAWFDLLADLVFGVGFDAVYIGFADELKKKKKALWVTSKAASSCTLDHFHPHPYHHLSCC
jgi:hypothetical protein